MLKHLDSYRDKHEDVWVGIFLAFAKAFINFSLASNFNFGNLDTLLPAVATLDHLVLLLISIFSTSTSSFFSLTDNLSYEPLFI